MAQGDFRWAPQISRELNQQVIGVVGTGHIGRVAIQIYQGFGAKVIAYDAFRNPELEKTGIYVDSLDELYAQATVVTLHVPLLDSTHHMLDQAAFAKMRPGTLIVNASRGPLIDEEALIAALDSGQIAGAALDVMEDETQVFNHDLGNRKPDYPAFNNLFARDNVLISPHRAFYTDVAVRNMVFESFQASRDLFEKGYSDKEVKF
ncbi:D-lactate dehydrogenase [Ligilactobacillus equi DPC 6820]|uniref:D-lactate dehydrogenase n=2 Tax=Ligilactobacillus equi TaxID=137357 RepID=V7HVJ6_9LACO|nr:D-lactate dehydrogenase [Ligilactobacillus equi DPC 6820]